MNQGEPAGDAPKPAEGEGENETPAAAAVLPEDSDSDEGIRDGAGHMGGGQSSEFVSGTYVI